MPSEAAAATTEGEARIAAALEVELAAEYDGQVPAERGPDDDDDGAAGALVPAR